MQAPRGAWRPASSSSLRLLSRLSRDYARGALRLLSPVVAGAVLLLLALQSIDARAQVSPEEVVLDDEGSRPARTSPEVGATAGPPARAEPGSREHVDAEEGGLSILVRAENATYIDSDAVSVISPTVALRLKSEASGWDVGGSYLVDAVSAASVDIVSTASGKWDEIRHVGSLDASHKGEVFTVGASGSVSVEPDYLSMTGGLSVSAELDEKHITPRFGYSYTDDTSGLNDTAFSDYSLPVTRHGLSAGAEFVVNRSTTFTVLGDFTYDSGDQKKPYRFLPVFAPDVAATLENGASIEQVNQLRLPGRMSENVPLTRQRVALTGRLAQRYAGSTLILKERLYGDSWGTQASTTTLRFVVDAGSRFYFWPEVRVHAQSGTAFYQLAYGAIQAPGQQVVPEFRTGDRELGPLLTGTGAIGFRWFIGSAAHPSGTALVFETEVAQTNYDAALFVSRRRSAFFTLQLESEF